jgi:hypothetical protein
LIDFFVPLFMAGLAKPNDVKRFFVILVMSDCLFFSASATGLSNKVTSTNCPCNTGVSQDPERVFSPPCASDFCRRLDALWLFAPRPVIGSYLFNIFIPVGCGIIFVALLTFIDMAVSHSRMGVKLAQRLDGVALKTIFHDRLLKAHHNRFD